MIKVGTGYTRLQNLVSRKGYTSFENFYLDSAFFFFFIPIVVGFGSHNPYYRIIFYYANQQFNINSS